MIRLHARPLPSSPFSKLSHFLSLSVCRRSSLPTGEWGRGRTWSRIMRPQESLDLYESFNPLWSTSLQRCKKPGAKVKSIEIYQKQILASSVIRKNIRSVRFVNCFWFRGPESTFCKLICTILYSIVPIQLCQVAEKNALQNKLR
jgi:hypothetical protein